MPLNKERAYQVMEDKKVDAIIASSLENVYYMSDYWSLGKQLRCGIQAFALLPLNGEPAIIAPLNEVDLIIDSETWIDDIYFFGSFDVEVVKKSNEVSDQTQKLIDLYEDAKPGEDAVTSLLRALDQRELIDRVIAIDTTGFSPNIFRQLQERLSKADIVMGEDLLQDVRLVKTKEEIEYIRRATEITEKSMEDALEITRPEIMELDLAGMFEYSIAYDGGRVTHNLIGFSERSAFPHPIPSTFEAGRGYTIRMTLGCTWRHYHSNVSRTAVIGRPRSWVKKKWEAIMNAQDSAIDLVSPGARISEIFDVAEKNLNAEGIKQVNNCFGHGLGVECNERPRIERDSDDELKEGMIINIDIPSLELGLGGVQIEDTFLVTEKGHERLTRTDRNLYML